MNHGNASSVVHYLCGVVFDDGPVALHHHPLHKRRKEGPDRCRILAPGHDCAQRIGCLLDIVVADIEIRIGLLLELDQALFQRGNLRLQLAQAACQVGKVRCVLAMQLEDVE
ncbi:hypothetical protein [Noviherbaspirillum sp.]|uniref:hypothetical protein n=1 Tax=Noviherbaspirillum sp. TaxID=1926288 RepID=UPI002D53E795|nr:hypothetical protein [Noviherbaspirillum sp.]HZW21774.1 hypothetical protein [Noviherbaspirillum sp.]